MYILYRKAKEKEKASIKKVRQVSQVAQEKCIMSESQNIDELQGAT